MKLFTEAYKSVSAKQTRDELILQHMEYVTHILSRIVAGLPDGIDTENLQSAGVLGLVEAAGKFDPTFGVAFKTFSYPRIRGAIIDEMRTNSPLSQKMMELVKSIRLAIESMEPPITPEAISKACGISVKKVESGLEAMRMNPLQWDSSHVEKSRTLWSEDRPEDRSDRVEQTKLLADAIEELPERDRLAISLYYLEGLRLKEIGQVLSISESRASRVLAKAELTLKQVCGVEF